MILIYAQVYESDTIFIIWVLILTEENIYKPNHQM